jgi:dTMP kinase
LVEDSFLEASRPRLDFLVKSPSYIEHGPIRRGLDYGLPIVEPAGVGLKRRAICERGSRQLEERHFSSQESVNPSILNYRGMAGETNLVFQMKMKVLVIPFAAATAIISHFSISYGFAFAIAFSAVFLAYGIAKSLVRGIDPLNDVPNGFRVLLATVGGSLIPHVGTFILPSVGILLVVSAALLNDEFQRRAFHAVTAGIRGGTVVFLGIDGSGKSTHAEATKRWFETRGYRCRLVPFHKYIIVDRLSRKAGPSSLEAGTGRPNPLRPLLSLFDNLLMLLWTSFGSGIAGTVVIYDRYIWSTYVKYSGLGYPVRPLSFMYLLPRPRVALLFEIPVERSLRVIDDRGNHIRYPGKVLSSERELYFSIARGRGYAVIDSTGSFESVQAKVEAKLSVTFPALKGV